MTTTTDHITIDPATLPTVDPEVPGYSGYVGLDGPGSATTAPVVLQSVAWHEYEARRQLALARYLREHPTAPDGTTRSSVPEQTNPGAERG